MNAADGATSRRGLLAAGGAAAALSATGLWAGAAPLPGQPQPAPPLPTGPGRMADVALFARAYETLHPGLWRYQSGGGWQAVLERLRHEAGAAPDHGHFWLAFARATAALRCGHSYVSPFNMGRRWSEVMSARQDRLPFRFRWIDRQMLVVKPLVAHDALAVGTRVAAIDGESDRQLLARMLPLARADGHNDAKRIANMEVRTNASRWENFDVMWRLDRTPPPGTARLRLEPPDGRAVTVELPLLGVDSRGNARADERLGWTARHAGDATILTMPSWTTYNSKWDWRGWLTGVIDEAVARGSARFVVDLRGNEGGEDCGDAILARIITAPIAEAGAARRVRFRETPADLRAALDTWDDSFHELGRGAAGPDADGFYTLPARADGPERLLPSEGPRLRARLIVLTDAANSSATFQFARRVQANRLGVLLGEPTGGNQRGINGGAFFFLRLPESRLEVDLPLIGYFPPGLPPDAGLTPDIGVPTRRADIVAGTDPQMARALGLAAA